MFSDDGLNFGYGFVSSLDDFNENFESNQDYGKVVNLKIVDGNFVPILISQW